MNVYRISTCTSTDVDSKVWKSYLAAFNSAFGLNRDLDDMKRKYMLTHKTFSYHVFAQVDDQIAGSCSVIPYKYIIGTEELSVGLVVDVFILEDHRTDPLLLFKMYRQLKDLLKNQEIDVIIAVPNDMAYPYWKRVVKWKDIGNLPYYVVPVKPRFNFDRRGYLTGILTKLLVRPFNYLSRYINDSGSDSLIRLDRTKANLLDEQRYGKEHKIIKSGTFYCSYLSFNESGKVVCYLIDFANPNGLKDGKSLSLSLHHITTNVVCDYVAYIGKLPFTQLSMLRLPNRLEPRKLRLMYDVINWDSSLDESVLGVMQNWDFGLYNYDVR